MSSLEINIEEGEERSLSDLIDDKDDVSMKSINDEFFLKYNENN